jgi:hypothetical protein
VMNSAKEKICDRTRFPAVTRTSSSDRLIISLNPVNHEIHGNEDDESRSFHRRPPPAHAKGSWRCWAAVFW